jgi:hypothetical protein
MLFSSFKNWLFHVLRIQKVLTIDKLGQASTISKHLSKVKISPISLWGLIYVQVVVQSTYGLPMVNVCIGFAISS